MFLHKDSSNYKFIHLYGGPLDGKIIPVAIDGQSMTVTIGVNTPEDIEDGLGHPDQPARLETLTYAPLSMADIENCVWRLVEPTVKNIAHDN